MKLGTLIIGLIGLFAIGFVIYILFSPSEKPNSPTPTPTPTQTKSPSQTIKPIETPSDTEEEDVDCQYGPWSWEQCKCDQLTKKGHREIMTKNQGHGHPCSEKLVDEESCPDVPCPVDCVTSPWSLCDVLTGTQTREIIQPARNFGTCNVSLIQPCSIDCVMSGWGPCSKTCGGGTQTKSILKQPINGGLACPEFTPTQSCNMQPC